MKIKMSNEAHPLLQQLLKDFSVQYGVPLEPMEDEKDFLKSDYCQECEGEGRIFVGLKSVFNPKTMDFYDVDVFEQCESCEELHAKELRADRLMDEWKGA